MDNPFQVIETKLARIEALLERRETESVRSEYPMTVKQAAQYIGISKETVGKMIKAGTIPFVRVSQKRIVFYRKDLDQWLADKRNSQ